MISVQYIPLSVRVRFWSLSLFPQNELEEFLTQDASFIISQVAKKEKHYSIANESHKEFSISIQNALSEYLHIGTIASIGATKSFIKELANEFEINSLKNIVRMIISGNYQHLILDDYTLSQSPFLMKIQDIRSIDELQSLLSHTPYHIFHSILEQVAQEKNSLAWELALDDYFISRIYHVTQRLDFDSRKAVKTLVLTPLQKDRIVSLYRYRFHYQVEPTEALKYVPNLKTVINSDNWTRLAFAISPTEFYDYLHEWEYIPENLPNHALALQMEFQKQLAKTSHRFLHKELTSIASFIAFFQLKKIQFKKIITILEAKNLQVSKTDIMQFL